MRNHKLFQKSLRISSKTRSRRKFLLMSRNQYIAHRQAVILKVAVTVAMTCTSCRCLEARIAEALTEVAISRLMWEWSAMCRSQGGRARAVRFRDDGAMLMKYAIVFSSESVGTRHNCSCRSARKSVSWYHETASSASKCCMSECTCWSLR